MKKLLKHLDTPVKILSLSVSDIIGYAAPFFVGSMLDSLLLTPLIGLILIYLTKRFLRRYPKFYLMRHLYWSLPTARFNKLLKASFPPSSKRFWCK